MEEIKEEKLTVSKQCSIEVQGGKSSLPVSLFRALAASSLLILSLFFYFIGIILTLTLIGSIFGIPIIISTYAIDAIALTVLINVREKVYLLKCPECHKNKLIMPALRERFLCKGCGSVVTVIMMEEDTENVEIQ